MRRAVEIAGGAGGNKGNVEMDVKEEDDPMLQVSNVETSAFPKQKYIRFYEEIKMQRGSMRSLMWALAGANYQLMVKDEEIRKLKLMMKGEEQLVVGDEDGLMSALSFLPEEIIEMILNYMMDSPEDLLNCSLADPIMSKICQNSKQSWLFEKIIPFIFHILDSDDVYNCRLTCKSWCTAVDSFLENHSTYRPYTKPDKDNHLLPIVTPPLDLTLRSQKFCRYNFREQEEEDEEFYLHDDMVMEEDALRHHLHWSIFEESHPRNPFIGGAVGVKYERELEWFVIDAMDFFETFGRHIVHFYFDMEGEISSQDPRYLFDSINSRLLTLPNLTCIELEGLCEVDVGGNQTIINWNSHIECKSPPYATHLAKLETLKINIIDLPFIVQDFIAAQYQHQLKRLEVPSWNPDIDCCLNENISQLNELHITKIKSSDDLLPLLYLKCPNLQKLHLKLWFQVEKPSFILGNLLKIVNHFPQLYCLSFEGYHFWNFPLQEMSRLPRSLYAESHLERLEFDGNIPSSSNFLLRFPSIKVVRVNMEGVAGDPDNYLQDKEEIIKLRRFLKSGKVYHSNVWEIIPSLNTLICWYACKGIVKMYTRDMYEKIWKFVD